MMKKIFISIFLLFLCIGCDEEAVDGNRPPVINRIDISHSLQAGMNRYVVDTDATDPDGDNVTYSFETNSNVAILASTSTALINITQFTGTPPNIIIKVIADDDKGGIATREFNLITGNKAPVILFYEADKYKLSRGETTKLHALVGDDDGSGDAYSTTFRISSPISSGVLNISTNNQSLPRASYTGSQTSSENAAIELEAIDTDNNLKASSVLVLEVGTGLVHVDSWDTTPAGAYALDFNSADNLFVTGISNEVLQLNDSGNIVDTWNVTTLSNVNLRALAVDKRSASGLVFLGSSNGNHDMLAYTQNGNASSSNNITFTGVVHYILHQSDGSMLVSDNASSSYKVVKIVNGQIAQTYGLGELSQPRQISVDPNTGNLYIADRGNNRVRVYASNGNFIRNLFGNNGSFDIPHGVLADRVHDAVFVSDTDNSRIQEFAFDGSFRENYQFNGVTQPRYTILGPDNRIYITSVPDKKVHIFEYR